MQSWNTKEKVMRPSSSLIYKQGPDRGIPRGRDLFTFVTSAASHMMRTLQRPRRSRPLKRQVNHRRFIHNMIHRKFAEIEAANQRLSSAIFSKESEGTKDSSPIYESTDLSDDTSEEADKLLPTVSSGSTSSSLTQFSTQKITLSNQQEELSSIWTFDLNWENSKESMDLLHNQKLGKELYQIDKESSQHTYQRGSWSPAVEDTCSTWRPNNTYMPNLDFNLGTHLQLEPVKTDCFIIPNSNIMDENSSRFVENVKKCNVISQCPDRDPSQEYSAVPLMSDICGPKFNLTPTPASEPQPMSPCSYAFWMKTDGDSHCFQIDVNNILENPHGEISDGCYAIDSREEEAYGDFLSPAGSVLEPQSGGSDQETQFSDMFLNAAFNMSTYRNEDLTLSEKSSNKGNTSVRTTDGIRCSDLDYPLASFPHLNALDPHRMNDEETRETETPGLSSETEGGGSSGKNCMAGCDSPSCTHPKFLSLIYSTQLDSQCPLEREDLKEFWPELQSVKPSVFINPPLLHPDLDQSSVPSVYHPDPTFFPNVCSQNETVSSGMKGGNSQSCTPFRDMAKFQTQKPYAHQILTPSLDDYCAIDNILGEHETRNLNRL